ncbi:MAG: hypothetical protein KDD82_00935, partial [Planctomycetes bacterium]|nr:hypothetical protein [Planctomycetota bacterium]
VTLSAGGAVLGELLVGQVTGVEPEDVREVGYALDTSQLGLFVRLPDEGRVYVVTDFVTRELEPDPRRWFAPPVPVRPEEVTRLQRAGPEGFDLLSGPFRFAGDPTPLDPRRAWGLLTWVAQLRTVAPADPELAQGGLALRLEAGDRAYALQLAERDGRMFLLLGERCVEVEPLAASRLLEATRASLVRTRLLLSDARDVVRVEATLGQRAVSFLRVRGGWVAGDGGAVPDLDGVLGALGGVPVTWGEPAVGKIAGASLQVIDAQGGSETLWLLEEAPADEERIGLGGVSLVARAAGRPLAEALQTLFGE